MKQFNDITGASWALTITLGTAKRVYNSIGVDLLNPTAQASDGTPISQRLLYDDLFMLDVVTSLIEEQLKRANLTAVDFADRVDGKIMKVIEETFWSEYRFFFEERGKSWMAKAIQMDCETKKKNAEDAEKQIDSIGVESVALQDAQA